MVFFNLRENSRNSPARSSLVKVMHNFVVCVREVVIRQSVKVVHNKLFRRETYIKSPLMGFLLLALADGHAARGGVVKIIKIYII